MSFFRATLTGRKPFSSFTVPGQNPSVVVNRQGALLDEDTARALKEALKAGDVPNVKPEDVAIVEVDQPGKPSASDDVEALRDRIAELEDEVEAAKDDDEPAKEVEALTAERDTAIAERDSARQQAAELTEQLADSDATGLASGILDSLTVPELSKLAEARKVEGLTSSSTKADIIKGLVAPQPSA